MVHLARTGRRQVRMGRRQVRTGRRQVRSGRRQVRSGIRQAYRHLGLAAIRRIGLRLTIMVPLESLTTTITGRVDQHQATLHQVLLEGSRQLIILANGVRHSTRQRGRLSTLDVLRLTHQHDRHSMLLQGVRPSTGLHSIMVLKDLAVHRLGQTAIMDDRREATTPDLQKEGHRAWMVPLDDLMRLLACSPRHPTEVRLAGAAALGVIATAPTATA